MGNKPPAMSAGHVYLKYQHLNHISNGEIIRFIRAAKQTITAFKAVPEYKLVINDLSATVDMFEIYLKERRKLALENPDQLGKIGSDLADNDWRYLKNGQQRHSIYPFDNDNDPERFTSHCGIIGDYIVWLGTGDQDEYEKLAKLPPCKRCQDELTKGY